MSAFPVGPPGNRKRRRCNARARAGIVVGAVPAFKLSPTTAGCECTVPSSPTRLVHRLAQSLAGLECGRPRGGDADRLAHARVAGAAGIPGAGAERAEASDGDGFVHCKGIVDVGETAATIRSASALVNERSVAMCDASWALFKSVSPCCAAGAAPIDAWLAIVIVPSPARPGKRVCGAVADLVWVRRCAFAGGTQHGRAWARLTRGSVGERSAAPPERDLPEDGLEAAERREVLGGAVRDEPRAVGVSPERDRQGLDGESRESFEEGKREPGDVGAGRHEEEPGGPCAHDGPHAGVRVLVDPVEQRAERGSGIARRRVRPPIKIHHPPTAREVGVGDGAFEQRMAAPGDDARGGHVEEALAEQELRQQRLARIDPAAVQVAPTLGEALKALGPLGRITEGSRFETMRRSLPKRAVHAGWPGPIHPLRPVTQAATPAI